MYIDLIEDMDAFSQLRENWDEVETLATDLDTLLRFWESKWRPRQVYG